MRAFVTSVVKHSLQYFIRNVYTYLQHTTTTHATCHLQSFGNGQKYSHCKHIYTKQWENLYFNLYLLQYRR